MKITTIIALLLFALLLPSASMRSTMGFGRASTMVTGVGDGGDPFTAGAGAEFRCECSTRPPGRSSANKRRAIMVVIFIGRPPTRLFDHT
jgi:hypothetical protein